MGSIYVLYMTIYKQHNMWCGKALSKTLGTLKYDIKLFTLNNLEKTGDRGSSTCLTVGARSSAPAQYTPSETHSLTNVGQEVITKVHSPQAMVGDYAF